MLENVEINTTNSVDIIPHNDQTAPLREVLHFVAAADGTPLVKNLVTGASYPNIADVTSFGHTVTSLEELYAAITVHAENGHALLTGGLEKPLINESRAGKAINTPTRILTLDIDSDDLPFTSRDELIQTLFGWPTKFVFQASAGAKHAGSLRGHYFLLLDKPMTRAAIKKWLKSLNFEHLRDNIKLSKSHIALKWPLDIIVNDAGRIIFIAPPICAADPIAERIVFHAHGEDFVEVPETIDGVDVQAEVARLRSDAKLPPKHIDPSEIITVTPDEIKITEVWEDGNFVRLNINGGDSSAYYFSIDNPSIVRNFKDEPAWRLVLSQS